MPYYRVKHLCYWWSISYKWCDKKIWTQIAKVSLSKNAVMHNCEPYIALYWCLSDWWVVITYKFAVHKRKLHFTPNWACLVLYLKIINSIKDFEANCQPSYFLIKTVCDQWLKSCFSYWNCNVIFTWKFLGQFAEEYFC